MNFIQYTQTEKDMCTFFIFGLSAIRPRDAVRPRPIKRTLILTYSWRHRSRHFCFRKSQVHTCSCNIHWQILAIDTCMICNSQIGSDKLCKTILWGHVTLTIMRLSKLYVLVAYLFFETLCGLNYKIRLKTLVSNSL